MRHILVTQPDIGTSLSYTAAVNERAAKRRCVGSNLADDIYWTCAIAARAWQMPTPSSDVCAWLVDSLPLSSCKTN